MPNYTKFEELPVWQEAARLYNCVEDLLEQPGVPLGPGFRNQLSRAALSVSNNIAEGFERVTTKELLSFLAIARGSVGEVRSMMAVIRNRPRLKPQLGHLQQIRELAESCARQITAWAGSLESSTIQGKRHLTGQEKQRREAIDKARNFRVRFLCSLKPDHPLYQTPEARAARGEPEPNSQ